MTEEVTNALKEQSLDDNNEDAVRYSVGDIVKIVGLKSRKEMNGQFGVVKAYLEESGRFEVVPPRGKNSLAVKPTNLTQDGVISPSDDAFDTERKFIHALFWPLIDDKIPVQAFQDWPEEWPDEIPFIKRKLGWNDPQIYGDVTSEGNAKPDFMMYFDAQDWESPENEVAQQIVSLLPQFELSKVTAVRQGHRFRGACILVYSPMKVTAFSSQNWPEGMGPPDGVPVMAGNPSRKFSLQQIRKVLEFHRTDRARAMYKAHDNPRHRVFGGM